MTTKTTHQSIVREPADDSNALVAAALREHRCRTRYAELSAADDTPAADVRKAWLAWWRAECDCRAAVSGFG